jgi:hypothetical protein
VKTLVNIKKTQYMGHRCFISFKTEDKEYKRYIQENLNVEMIDYSLDEAIDSDDIEYVMRVIREQYLSDSTVTLFLIGERSNENLGTYEQRYLKRELQASLYHRIGNTQNGILGIVLPSMYSSIYRGAGICSICGNSHNYINIMDSTVINEFSYNYYIPNDKCFWAEDDRFCVLVRWDEFIIDPEKYIDKAFEKRSHPITEKTKVRP